MVDARDFMDLENMDPELEAKAGQLQLMDGPITRQEKRGTARKRQGHIWLEATGRARRQYDVVVCDRNDWAVTLISDAEPPMGAEVELEWEGDGGVLKRMFGRVTGTRHGVRAQESLPDLYFSRFESTFL